MEQLIDSLTILLASDCPNPHASAVRVMKLLASGLRHASQTESSADVSFATWTTAKWIETELVSDSKEILPTQNQPTSL